MLSAHDNDLLTLTGSGTPMGDLLRRYWIPVVLSSEVAAGGRNSGATQSLRNSTAHCSQSI